MKEDCKKIAPEIQSLSAEVSSLKSGIAETYTEVVDLKYRQGMERIEASHQVYSDRVSVNLEDWVNKFDRLELEMEAEFRLYTNYQRVRGKRLRIIVHFFLVPDLQIFEDHQQERRGRSLQANLRIYPGSERLNLKLGGTNLKYFYFQPNIFRW